MRAPRISNGTLAVIAVYAGFIGFALGATWSTRKAEGEERQRELNRRLRNLELELHPPEESGLKPMPVRIVEA
jgi:hypothetical protein